MADAAPSRPSPSDDHDQSTTATDLSQGLNKLSHLGYDKGSNKYDSDVHEPVDLSPAPLNLTASQLYTLSPVPIYIDTNSPVSPFTKPKKPIPEVVVSFCDTIGTSSETDP